MDYMVSLYRSFAHALAWNTLECLLYQALFLAHQCALFSCAPASLYGLVGTLFSLVYLTVHFGNGGLDASLPPFFNQSSMSKESFKALVVPQIIVNIILYTMLLLGGYIGSSWLLPLPISPSLYGILSVLVFSEALKKTARTLLHLAFYNKMTALFEMCSISIYTATVWGIYYMWGTLSVYTIFIPMVLVSLLTTTLLLQSVYAWYTKLSETSVNDTVIPIKRIIKSRFFTSMYTVGHMVFSSNFIVPLCAARFGFEHAGALKFISTIAYTITAIMHRIFGFSFDALFLRITHTKNKIAEQEAFSLATEKLHHLLYGIILFLAINYHKLIALHTHTAPLFTTNSTLIFLILMLSEHLFTVYEKFYIAKERTDVLVVLHSMVSITVYGIIKYTTGNSLAHMLGIILLIRLAACTVLTALSYKQWHIAPSFRLNMRYLVAALSIAVLFFICV